MDPRHRREDQGQHRRERIAVAATLKTLNNTHTNAQGQLAGLARGRIIANSSSTTIPSSPPGPASTPASTPHVEAKMDLDRLAARNRATATRDFLFQIIKPGPIALYQATTLVRLAAERAKPDAERDPDYMNRELPALSNTLERQQKSFFRPADEAMFKIWVERAWELGAGERIQAIDKLVPRDRIPQTVAALYTGTRVTDPVERAKMFEETTDQLRARKDPLLDLAFALEPELRAWQAQTQTTEGAVARLRPAMAPRRDRARRQARRARRQQHPARQFRARQRLLAPRRHAVHAPDHPRRHARKAHR